jgi:hypothetical protein
MQGIELWYLGRPVPSRRLYPGCRLKTRDFQNVVYLVLCLASGGIVKFANATTA